MPDSSAIAREELFDAAFLDRLRSLALRLRKRRALSRRGSQSTPSTGFTREFKDYRHYTPREDYRAIDWRLYARLDKLFVRLYEETQELNLHLLVDTSGSMAEPYSTKRTQALRFAVALAYLGLAGQQRVSLYSMSDTIRQELPPLRGQGNIEKIIQTASRLKFGGFTDLQRSFAEFHPTRQRYGVIFVISDFFGRDVSTAAESIKRAAAWPGECHFLQILHPEERVPTLEGEVELDEVETGERRRFWLTRRDVQRYTDTFDAFCDELSRECAAHRIDFMQCGAEEPFEQRFLDLLNRGSALAGA
ncbi:DUF58 domain-containing protein [Brevifollis gellanilyticus]|uniref:DUF58 domain-containing protein n=1 Tax=Brevifollis gellanilyticus TaxID=748831 RepID=A0A512M800_9BACT|nr:DUF58 domain-containing protein [Brevifollis gellanilyticus]GEP42859.1 hypothetical protein BGE01nite_21500 [Brevifollis gellanilyticus]